MPKNLRNALYVIKKTHFFVKCCHRRCVRKLKRYVRWLKNVAMTTILKLEEIYPRPYTYFIFVNLLDSNIYIK